MLRWFAAVLLMLSCATPPPPPPPPAVDYREELRRYGEWILVSPYGKLWHPNTAEVGKDFVPYLTGGQWVKKAQGWTFEGHWPWSDYVFRHGRWLWTNDYDWLWSLDEREGVAFVKWKAGSEYVGWAPIPPQARGNPPVEERWTYVKARHFTQENLERFRLGAEESTKASNLSEPLPATATWSGPAVEFIVTHGGLVAEPDGGYRPPELAAPTGPEPAVEDATPASGVEVVKPEEEPPPPPPKATKKKAKKGKKR